MYVQVSFIEFTVLSKSNPLMTSQSGAPTRSYYYELFMVGIHKGCNFKTRRFAVRKNDKIEALGRMLAYANKLLSGNHINVEQYDELYGTVDEVFSAECRFVFERTGNDPRL